MSISFPRSRWVPPASLDDASRAMFSAAMLLSSGARFLSFSLTATLGLAVSTFAAESSPSPFLPPDTTTEAAPTPDAPIELRGIMTAGDNVMFSIYDTATRSSSWVRLNQTGGPFIVRSYDAARDTVTVDHNGRTVTLALKTAKVASAPVAAPQPAVAAANVPQPVTGPVVLNPTPADEQRRLEAIAAEVNRRRQLRQQALQASRQAAGQPPQGLPPGATPPPQPQR